MNPGFYKYFTEENTLRYAPNFVHTPTGSIFKETKGTIEDWVWFDSEEEALNFYAVDKDTIE